MSLVDRLISIQKLTSDEVELYQGAMQKMAENKDRDLQAMLDIAINLANPETEYHPSSTGALLQKHGVQAIVDDFTGVSFLFENRGDDWLEEEVSYGVLTEIIPRLFTEVEFKQTPEFSDQLMVRSLMVACKDRDLLQGRDKVEFEIDSLQWQFIRPYTKREIELITMGGRETHTIIRSLDYGFNGKDTPKMVERRIPKIPADGLYRRCADLKAKIEIIKDRRTISIPYISGWDEDYARTPDPKLGHLNEWKDAVYQVYFVTIKFRTTDWTDISDMTTTPEWEF